MWACESIIKNKQHGSLKRGNFGGKPKFYGASKQTEKKRVAEKQKLIRKKERHFRGLKRYFLDSLKRYKVIVGLSEKDFDAYKIVQYSKQ